MPEQNLAVRVAARIQSREARLKTLGYESYTAFIASPRWAETRTRYWEDDDTPKVCGLCKTDEPPLALHHRTYERVGAERLTDLVPVCNTCHHIVHALEKRGDVALDVDLDDFADPVRASKYRAERSEDATPPSSANLAQRRSIEGRLRVTEAELAKAVARPKPAFAIESYERKVRRAKGRLLWLEAHPQMTLPSEANHQEAHRRRGEQRRRKRKEQLEAEYALKEEREKCPSHAHPDQANHRT